MLGYVVLVCLGFGGRICMKFIMFCLIVIK